MAYPTEYNAQDICGICHCVVPQTHMLIHLDNMHRGIRCSESIRVDNVPTYCTTIGDHVWHTAHPESHQAMIIQWR